jgi:peroxiredoxin
VLAISNDSQADARRLAAELGLDFPVLANPSMDVIHRYGMKGKGMAMADMGYVAVDGNGRIRMQAVDRQFGEHALNIAAAIRQATATNARTR